MKKVQDYYFKKAKKENYPARSVYKLEEAQQKYHLLSKGDSVLDLGCHPGSWSMYAAKVVGPQGMVVGVDLQKGKQPPQVNGAKITILQADILDDEVISRLRELCGGFSVVVSDMAPGTTGNKWTDQQQSLVLARRALELAGALLREGGNFYCKVFDGEDCKEYIDSLRPLYAKVKVVKPKSSRKESPELFVLGMDKLPLP